MAKNKATLATSNPNLPIRTNATTVDAMATPIDDKGQVIDKSSPATLDRTLADFESEENLSPDQRRIVERAVTEIHNWRNQMVENMLLIGKKLKDLRDTLTSGQWATFCKGVLPKMGISASTAKRWLQAAIETERLIPNADFRRQVMAIGDGRAIVLEETMETSDGKQRVTKLSPHFDKAMEANPLPTNPTPTQVEETARKVLTLASHLRAAAQQAARDSSTGTRVLRGYNAVAGIFLNNPKTDAERVMEELVKSFARQFGRDDTIVLSTRLRQIAESGDYTRRIGTTETATDVKNDEKATSKAA